MVSLGYDWYNPSPREGEEQGLAEVVNTASESDDYYEGTTKEDILDILDIQGGLSAMEDIGYDVLVEYLSKFADYCVGNILRNEEPNQIFHYRRLEMVNDILDDLEELGVVSDGIAFLDRLKNN